jgi:hypothetical protein
VIPGCTYKAETGSLTADFMAGFKSMLQISGNRQ